MIMQKFRPIGLFLFLLLSACSSSELGSVTDGSFPLAITGVMETEKESTLSLPSCSEQDCCYQNKTCVRQCIELFSKQKKVDRCLHLPSLWVKKMDQLINHVLADPEEKSLRNINVQVWWSVMTLSPEPYLRKIRNYDRKSAQIILRYIGANNREFNKMFQTLNSSVKSNILIALLRQNTNIALLDDNRLLSGLKTPLWEKEEEISFLKLMEKHQNSTLMLFVHRKIISKHLCDYTINQPRPTDYPVPAESSRSQSKASSMLFRGNKYSHSACVLAVYCHLTGDYTDGQYVPEPDQQDGRRLRKRMAKELKSSRVRRFIQAPQTIGGLNLEESADEWPDPACARLAELYDSAQLQFGL